MDMKKSTVEVVVQAEQLRKEAGSDKMYVEYVFYGLLKVASYLEDPRKGMEYRGEAEELRLFLEEQMRSISSARMKLKEDAMNGSKSFDDAAVPVGRAAEIAGGSQFSPLDLAKAILEDPSPVIREACRVKTAAGAAEDARYDPGATVVDVGNLSSAADDLRKQQEEEEERKRREAEEQRKKEEAKRRREELARKRKEEEERKKKEEEDRLRREQEEERKRRAEEARKRKEEEERKKQEESGNGMTMEQLRQLFDMLPVPDKKKKKTKIGLITFRGGKTAAVLQYIALALLLPFAIAAAVELLTGRGIVTHPPTEWAAFGVRMFLLLWAFWVFRGLCDLIGIWSKSFCLYLRTYGDVALIMWITVSVKTIFGMPEYPVWIRYVSGILAILVMSVGAALYESLGYSDEQKKRSIKFVSAQGPVPKVVFQKLTRLGLFPCAILLGLWITTHTQGHPGSMFAGLFGNPIEPLQDWQIKAIWIGEFIFAWNVPYTILTSLHLGAKSRWYYGGGEGLIKFAAAFWTMMFIPLMVLFLHWLFKWYPMQLWVIIVLGVYTLFSVITGIVSAKS